MDKKEQKRLRLQDVADMLGVSRTTVSNVLHGKTKKVSMETIKKIRQVLDEQGYVPNMSSRMLVSNVSKIIGIVMSGYYSHGIYASMDPFVGEFIGAVEEEARKAGYYIMLIQGLTIDEVSEVASRWNIDGLIILFFTPEDYYQLKRKLNKDIIMVDAYDKEQYNTGIYKEVEKSFYNVGINDYEGGRMIGRYLLDNGYPNALYAAETNTDTDYVRWLGFKLEMEKSGIPCNIDRYVLLSHQKEARFWKLEKLITALIETHKAIAFASDYNASEAINFFRDHKIMVPDQISVTGFDGNVFSDIIRPCLTTVAQDVTQKGQVTVRRLVELINNENTEIFHTRLSVELQIKDSVKTR